MINRKNPKLVKFYDQILTRSINPPSVNNNLCLPLISITSIHDEISFLKYSDIHFSYVEFLKPNPDRLKERHLMVIREALRARNFSQSEFTKLASEFIVAGLKIAKQSDKVIQ